MMDFMMWLEAKKQGTKVQGGVLNNPIKLASSSGVSSADVFRDQGTGKPLTKRTDGKSKRRKS